MLWNCPSTLGIPVPKTAAQFLAASFRKRRACLKSAWLEEMPMSREEKLEL